MATWQDPKIMSFWIWGVILIVLFLITYMFLFIKNYVTRLMRENEKQADLKLSTQKDLLKHTLFIQEEERSRIAMDLHDNLISQLNIIRMLNENEEDRSQINHQLKESMKTARRVSHDLSPPLINEMNLRDLMADYVHSLKVGLDVHFYCSQSNNQVQLAQVNLHFFRIFQEIITNCLKHAKATKIDIIFRNTSGYIALNVSDNGIGYTPKNGVGIGLKNIESRAQFLNAKYRFKSIKGAGTHFILCLKIND